MSRNISNNIRLKFRPSSSSRPNNNNRFNSKFRYSRFRYRRGCLDKFRCLYSKAPGLGLVEWPSKDSLINFLGLQWVALEDLKWVDLVGLTNRLQIIHKGRQALLLSGIMGDRVRFKVRVSLKYSNNRCSSNRYSRVLPLSSLSLPNSKGRVDLRVIISLQNRPYNTSSGRGTLQQAYNLGKCNNSSNSKSRSLRIRNRRSKINSNSFKVTGLGLEVFQLGHNKALESPQELECRVGQDIKIY